MRHCPVCGATILLGGYLFLRNDCALQPTFVLTPDDIWITHKDGTKIICQGWFRRTIDRR